jgi:hypothetical protein
VISSSGPQVRVRREGIRGDLADHGLEPGNALHEQDPVGEDREQEIRARAREQHGDARERRPPVESAMFLARRHRPVSLVEQAHVAAERDR